MIAKYHTIKEEAARLGISIRTLRAWQKTKVVPSIVLVPGKGGIIRFNPEAVDAALEKFSTLSNQRRTK